MSLGSEIIDFKAMAKDPKGAKILRGALKQMVEGWAEDDPDLDVEDTVEMGFEYVAKHGTIGKPEEGTHG